MSITTLLVTHFLAFLAGGAAVVGVALMSAAKGNADAPDVVGDSSHGSPYKTPA